MTAEELSGPAPGRRPGGRPVLTWLVSLVASALALWPGAPELLELERVRCLQGEPWRLLGGHLVHYSREHWFMDVLAFVVLGWACERRAPGRTRLALALAALVISAGVLLLQPELERYRGLSGLDSALFGLLLGLSWRAGAWRTWVLASLFAGKLLWELASGAALFVHAEAAGFVPVPLAHVLGALVGFGCAFYRLALWRLALRRAMTTLGLS